MEKVYKKHLVSSSEESTWTTSSNIIYQKKRKQKNVNVIYKIMYRYKKLDWPVDKKLDWSGIFKNALNAKISKGGTM